MTEKAQLDFIWKQIKERAQELIVYYSFITFIDPLIPVDIINRRIILKAGSELAAGHYNEKSLRKAERGYNERKRGIKRL